ncbi:MAG: LysR substrate-binding domain-containing protein [Rubricella sp.]
MAMESITLKQLRGLLAVAQAQNFRKAAENLGLTQPSLSAQIQTLEATLGATLVERSRQGALLTPIGREVAQRARRILDETTALTDLVTTSRKGLSMSIRLGVMPTVGAYLLPTVVDRLHGDHPDLRLYIRESAPRRLVQELVDGVHDVIITHLPVPDADLEVKEVYREPFLLTLAKDHPLAAQAEIRTDDLRGLEILSLDPSYHLHDPLMGVFETFGARVSPSYEGTSLDALRLMTGMNMGVTFLPALYVRSEIHQGSEVVARKLSNRSLSRSMGLAWRGSARGNSAFEALRKVVQDSFEVLGQQVMRGL